MLHDADLCPSPLDHQKIKVDKIRSGARINDRLHTLTRFAHRYHRQQHNSQPVAAIEVVEPRRKDARQHGVHAPAYAATLRLYQPVSRTRISQNTSNPSSRSWGTKESGVT